MLANAKFELWDDSVPNTEHIGVFGSLAHAYVPK